MKKVVLLLLISIGVFCGIFLYDYYRFNDGKLHVIFCDVGQGDAVFIRTPSGKNILYDGGPDKKVLDCLSSYMPFWERNIHLLFLSHPHDDHFNGMYYVIDRYIALAFDTEDLVNKTPSFNYFLELIVERKIPTKKIFAGDKYTLSDGVMIRVLGPSKEYLEQTSPGGTIGESKEFGSVILKVSYGEFDLLLTGDSQTDGLSAFAKASADKGEWEVLQVPHHGSRFGLDEKLVESLNPRVAVISVGKNNYGHPSKEVLKILSERDIKILRTDEEGDIEIVSDGKEWKVK